MLFAANLVLRLVIVNVRLSLTSSNVHLFFYNKKLQLASNKIDN